MEAALFQKLMAATLVDLGEHRRAIPFFEKSIQSEVEQNDPLRMADVLWRTGRCYAQSGLRDHAAIPLRAAVKIFRACPGDPRLPSTLLTLGNALRKASPAEAERYYREAAEWHEAKGQFESATPAWVNLGVLCSEQGRHEESLAFYEKARQIREHMPGTPPSRLGSLLNNIANCYRRMGKFEEAHESVGRAIAALEPEGTSGLASAYGTKGLIFRDQGRDADAVEWLRKAHGEYEKGRSSNVETIAEDLENEIAALKRLERDPEALIAEAKLISLRNVIKSIPQTDRDLSGVNGAMEDGVLIELSYESRPGSRYRDVEFTKLAMKLSEALRDEEVGSYGGRVMIPESTTLMFYGADAEILFRRLEPILAAEGICAGGRVTIRRNSSYREVFLPKKVM